jgi:hypothetical protein
MRFVYSLIRFVPDPARGEFVNVGAVVGSDESSEWEVRQVENPVRARALDDRSALDAVWAFIDSVGNQIDEFEQGSASLFGPSIELSEDWLERLYRDHQNIVQLSAPTPMVADSADEALERIFDLLVLDPAQRKYRFRKKHAALAALRAAYSTHAIQKGRDLRERVVLETPHHRERFDFAVTNGRALQLTHTWSFQVPDQDALSEQIKAWGWTVGDARSNGGQIAAPDGSIFSVETDIDIEVVFVPPASGQEAPALAEAQNVFASLDVTAVALDDADAVADRADRLLVEAGIGRLDIH